MSQYTLPRNVSHYQALKRALSSLRSCGCHDLWEEFTRLTIEGKSIIVDFKRIELCIKEQCWSNHDVDMGALTVSDRLLPFPVGVKRALFAKLEGIRSHKQRALQEANRARRNLQERHATCRSGPRRCMDNVSEATRSIAEAYFLSRWEEVIGEVDVLIRESAWQSHVDPNRVCNLTTNEVSNTELEILSLGTDFRLGSSRASVIDVVSGFQTYESKYRCKPGYLDLQREKVRVLSDLQKDSTPPSPVDTIKPSYP